jgi:hypothetical protein
MRTTIVIAVTVLALSGCTPEESEVRGGPPARHVVVGQLPDQPFHDADRPTDGLSPSSEPDPSDPGAVAMDRIAEGLTAQGLEILDLGDQTITMADGHVTVRVAATHRTGPGATPHTSVYELDLRRTSDGQWSVIRSRTVG